MKQATPDQIKNQAKLLATGVGISAVLLLIMIFANSSNGFGMAIVLAVTLGGYFFPSIIAGYRHHHQTLAIFLLNLLLGWTGLGWIGALVWAATAVVRYDSPVRTTTSPY